MPLRILDEEIQGAFTKLIRSRYVSETHCFCFFIDGLDEFHETVQDDHKAITELLCQWTSSAPKMVKLCVSSREYNVFMNAFSPGQRLRLHDLTKGDMEEFIQQRLGHIPDGESKKTLVRAAIDKAQGIFLWVALVVKSMR